MLDALGEPAGPASDCVGCNVVHLPVRPRRDRAEPLSDDEIRAIRTVFQCCPIARRAKEQ